ncbi:hypothetical protein JB92DRAFT_2840794 [Gautieria morchelliformis]|nr:hypothetical protein JB92DRAFT_2840794 [Gautieria morchelliformis]
MDACVCGDGLTGTRTCGLWREYGRVWAMGTAHEARGGCMICCQSCEDFNTMGG